MSNNNSVLTENIPINRTAKHKIGKTTFIVSTAFNDGKERDIFKIIARLIQNDKSESAG